MSEIRLLIKDLTEVWPILLFIGGVILGYINLRHQVEALKEKLKEAKEKSVDDKEDVEKDIKGVSIKTNIVMENMITEFKSVRKENADNHLSSSNEIKEIKGMVSSLILMINHNSK